MSQASTTRSDPGDATGRRSFLKRAALAALALSALSLLSRRPWSRNRSSSRSIPPDVPGAGSIFQPRNDTRRQ